MKKRKMKGKKIKKNKLQNRQSKDNKSEKDYKKNVELAKNILNGSGEFLSKVLIMGQENRDRGKQNLGELLQAHQISVSVIWSVIKKSQKPGKTSESISDRLVLVCSFIQGIDICETAISSGLYTQATALLKQELETLAAIEEIKTGKRMIRKTPNVSNVKWRLADFYGFLNRISHVADKELLHPIYNGKSYTEISEAHPVTVFPSYNKELSVGLYALHVCLLIQLINLMANLFEEQYGEPISLMEVAMVTDAVKILEKNGIIKDLKLEEK